jgi:hypothetical protein
MKSVVVGAMLLRTIYAQDTGAQPIRQGTGALPAAAAPFPALPVVGAQSPAVGAVAPVASPVVAPLAPVLIPGTNAPSEAELLGPVAGLVPSLGAESVLPTGTADVILNRPTSAAPFGAGTTPGTGIGFGPNGLIPNGANVASAVSPLLSVASAPAPVASAPVFGGRPVVPSRQGGLGAFAVAEPSLVDIPVAVDATPAVGVLPTSLEVPIASPIDALPIFSDTPIESPLGVLPEVPVPILSDVPIASPLGALAEVPVPIASPSVVLPEVPVPVLLDVPIASPSVALPEVPVSGSSDVPIISIPAVSDVPSAIQGITPFQVLPSDVPGSVDTLSGMASPLGSGPYTGPFDPHSIYDPNSPYYDPYAKPLGWEGNDNGIYDGEDDEDGEECPSWCIPEYDSSPYVTMTTPAAAESTYEAAPYQQYETTPEYTPDPTPTPAYDAEVQYYPGTETNSYYPQLKKVRSILRAVRRQVFNWPSALPSPAPYSDDDDSDSYDGQDGSIPDWLYELSGAPTKPTATPISKPVCPKSCYKPKYTDSAYDDASPTVTDPYETESPEPTTDGYYPAGNDSAVYWPTGVTSVNDDSTSIYDGYTAIPSEPTSAAVPEPSTLMTQYYPKTTSGASPDPGSPAGDYTGDTLDTLCPNTCNPFNPVENFCDITTGCATTGGSKYYCACRAGFRADKYNAKDFSKQFKVAGQTYVYLAVSTTCDTPCDDPYCSEVLERNHCK